MTMTMIWWINGKANFIYHPHDHKYFVNLIFLMRKLIFEILITFDGTNVEHHQLIDRLMDISFCVSIVNIFICIFYVMTTLSCVYILCHSKSKKRQKNNVFDIIKCDISVAERPFIEMYFCFIYTSTTSYRTLLIAAYYSIMTWWSIFIVDDNVAVFQHANIIFWVIPNIISSFFFLLILFRNNMSDQVFYCGPTKPFVFVCIYCNGRQQQNIVRFLAAHVSRCSRTKYRREKNYFSRIEIL